MDFDTVSIREWHKDYQNRLARSICRQSGRYNDGSDVAGESGEADLASMFLKLGQRLDAPAMRLDDQLLGARSHQQEHRATM